MSSNYSIKSNPSLNDLPLIWDEENSSWKRTPFSSIYDLFINQGDGTGVMREPQSLYFTLSSAGFRISAGDNDNDQHLIIMPSAELAYGTIALPNTSTLRDKQTILVTSTQRVVELTIDAADATINGAPTTIESNGWFAIKYDKAYEVWNIISDRTSIFPSGISLTSGRVASQELATRPTITASGWYKVFYVPSGATTFKAREADFRCSYLNNILNFSAGFSDGGSTNYNQHIETKPSTGEVSKSSTVYGARLGYDPSSTGKGAVVEVYVDATISGDLGTQILGNFDSNQSGTGWLKYDVPVLSDGLLPDGVTTATFIEAGAEYSFISGEISPFQARKRNDDSLAFTARWPENPKNGSGLELVYPSTDFEIRDGAGTGVNVTSGTVSNFAINGKNVSWRLTNIGAFTTLNNGPAVCIVNGSGGKLTITG